MSEEQTKMLGVDTFAYKPFTQKDFAKTVKKVLRWGVKRVMFLGE
jgi:3-methyladenine DNA glycosylase AlkC